MPDELYRRSLLIQVNNGERRHGLARTVFHGRGVELELRQAHREGQEDHPRSARTEDTVFAILVVGSLVAPIVEGVAINPPDTGQPPGDRRGRLMATHRQTATA